MKMKMFKRFSPQRLLVCLGWTTGSVLKGVSYVTSTKTREVHYSTYVEDTTNDLNIKFVFLPHLGNLAKIPVCKKSSSAFNCTVYERSFAVMGPKMRYYIPYNLNSIQDMDLFKMGLTEILIMSVPDTPPVQGYTPKNSNSFFCWCKDKGASAS